MLCLGNCSLCSGRVVWKDNDEVVCEQCGAVPSTNTTQRIIPMRPGPEAMTEIRAAAEELAHAWEYTRYPIEEIAADFLGWKRRAKQAEARVQELEHQAKCWRLAQRASWYRPFLDDEDPRWTVTIGPIHNGGTILGKGRTWREAMEAAAGNWEED